MGSRDLLIRPEVIAAESARLREELHRLADQQICERPVDPTNDVENIGSPGRIRTSDQPVNSRLLYH
jgi:hypothetical protein